MLGLVLCSVCSLSFHSLLKMGPRVSGLCRVAHALMLCNMRKDRKLLRLLNSVLLLTTAHGLQVERNCIHVDDGQKMLHKHPEHFSTFCRAEDTVHVVRCCWPLCYLLSCCNMMRKMFLWRQPVWATKNAGFTIDHVTCLLRCENVVSIEVFVV
jgi:hypothetical protein